MPFLNQKQILEKIKNCYRIKNRIGLARYTTRIRRQKKWRISDYCESRSAPSFRNQFRQKEGHLNTPTVARVLSSARTRRSPVAPL